MNLHWYIGIVVLFVVQLDSSHVTHVSEYDDTPNSEDYDNDYDNEMTGRPIYGSRQNENRTNSQISGMTQKTDVVNEIVEFTMNHPTTISSTKTIETVSTMQSPFGGYSRRINTSPKVGAWKTVFPLRNNSPSSGKTSSEHTFPFSFLKP